MIGKELPGLQLLVQIPMVMAHIKATIDGNEITLKVAGSATDYTDAATVSGGTLYTEATDKLTTHATNLAAKESDLALKNATGTGGSLKMVLLLIISMQRGGTDTSNKQMYVKKCRYH